MTSLRTARTLLPLALAISALSPGSGMPSFIGEAVAQTEEAPAAGEQRQAREERKVLSARDVAQGAIQDVYAEMAHQKRLESIKFLKDLLRQGTAQGEQRAEMLLRLADLYFEEGRYWYFKEMSAFQIQYDACFNDPVCAKTIETMKADNTGSKDWQDKSIKLYQQILDNYPQYQRADEATFYLATAMKDTGQDEEAVKEFTRLVRTYPESKYVPDSYVMIGEYYFDSNNAYKALVAYQKAATFKESDKYAFSLYKLAWCYYNVGEYGKAIETMKTVVANAMSSAAATEAAAAAGTTGTGSSSKIQLQDEALKDLVRFFADAGEMDEAYEYFNKLGKKDLIRSMLKRLADMYFEQGKFEQCIQTYQRLIAEDPESRDAPDYQNEIIQAYQKIGRKEDTLREIDKLLKNYGRTSAWARTNASNKEALDGANNYIEKNLRTVATNYHNEAKKLGASQAAKDTYALAYKAYTVYLQEFPDSKYSYDVRYAFSELLYKIKRYDEAYEQYMKVVTMDPRGSHANFCAESAIFAADEMVKKETAAAPPAAPGKATEPLPLGNWEQKLLTALDQFSTLFPTDAKTKNIIYRSAYLLYNKNHFKDASDRFRTVIGMDPASREAEQAANLILDSFNLVEDWTNLKDVSKAFYDQQGLGSTAFKKEVYDIYERASFKLIEVSFAKNQDKAKGALDYWGFYQEFPQSTVADVAINNAAVYFYDTANLKRAMEARQALIDGFPKSKYYNDQVAALGFDYESIADFDSAAKWYEKLFTLNKDHAQAADALYSAALFRRALGDWQGAIKNYQQYITAYPTRPNVNDVTLEIARLYEDNQKWTEASKVYFTFFKKSDTTPIPADQVYFARLHYGIDLQNLGQATAAEKHFKETITEAEKAKTRGVDIGAGIEFVAEAMFRVAESQFKTFEAMGITGPSSKTGRKATDQALMDQLKRKALALKDVEATYGAIINTGAGEWGLASLVQLGKAYENMASTLKNSYIPDYLTADQRELYVMALEDKIFPQQEKAVEAFRKALEKSFEISLYNDLTAYATRRLGELRPDDFPALEEGLLKAEYNSVKANPAAYESKP